MQPCTRVSNMRVQAAPARASGMVVRAAAQRASWLPGYELPAYLTGERLCRDPLYLVILLSSFCCYVTTRSSALSRATSTTTSMLN